MPITVERTGYFAHRHGDAKGRQLSRPARKSLLDTGCQGTQRLRRFVVDKTTVSINGNRYDRSTSVTGRHGRRPWYRRWAAEILSPVQGNFQHVLLRGSPKVASKRKTSRTKCQTTRRRTRHWVQRGALLIPSAIRKSCSQTPKAET